jgi:hypothetical protein
MELPEEAFRAWAPELPALADEIIAAIGEEVPEYSRPLEGNFGAAVRTGVQEALRRFGEDRGGAPADPGRRSVYQALGRGEARDGRSLEVLLAAYRVGARVAWRRLAATGVEAGLPPDTLVVVAEALFAYIDELSAESAEGYAQEQAARAGRAERRRAACIALLVHDPAPTDTALAASAAAAEWTVPATLAVVAWPAGEGRPARRLPLGCLAAPVDGVWCAAVPDPLAPGRRAELARAFGATPAGLGPAVAPVEAARSFRRARAALALAEGPGGLLASDEHRVALLLGADTTLVAELADARLAPLAAETPASRARLEATLLAWLRHQGNATQAAEELGVHGQTVRYRLGRLRELLGDALDDPDARYELETVLRARA